MIQSVFELILVILAAGVFTYSLIARTEKTLILGLFLAPWQALQVNVGVTVSLSQFVLLGLFVQLLLSSSSNFQPKEAVGLLLLVLLGFLSGLMSVLMLDGTISVIIRLIVSTGVFLITSAGFFICASRCSLRINSVVRAIVYSGVLLAILAVFQTGIYLAIGIDIFPLGLFSGSGFDLGNSAIINTSSGEIFRAASLAGEPKSLGIFSIVSLMALLLFWRLFRMRLVFIVFLMASVLLSNSTSAFFIFGIGVICLILARFRFPLGKLIYGLSFVIIASITFAYVGANDLIPYHLKFDVPRSLSDLIFQRTIGRFEVEDSDHVIAESFLDNSFLWLLGKGSGLAHLNTRDFVPEYFSYLRDYLIAPKSGAVLILSNFGLIGSVIFVLVFTSIANRYKVFARRLSLGVMYQMFCYFLLFSFLSFLIRAYLFEFTMILFSCALLVVRQYSQSRDHVDESGSTRLNPDDIGG